MDDPEFIQRSRLDDRAFTRARKLTFSTLIRFLLNHRKGSLQTELDHFSAILTATKRHSAM